MDGYKPRESVEGALFISLECRAVGAERRQCMHATPFSISCLLTRCHWKKQGLGIQIILTAQV